MSENEIKDNDEKLENAISDNDYTMEVKQSFFAKLFNRKNQQALPDPNRKVKTTGMSIDFMWKMRTLRADAMDWIADRMDAIKNMFSGNKEVEDEYKNGFKKQVIGQEEEINLEDLAKEGPVNQIIMPQVKQQVPSVANKGTMIDNSKTAEDVRREAAETGVEVEDITLDDTFEKTEEAKVEDKKTEAPAKVGIEVGDIELGHEDPNLNKEDNSEER